jgi:hypothetical protein
MGGDMEVAEASKQKFIQFWVEEMPGMPKLHYQHYLLNINSDSYALQKPISHGLGEYCK